MRKEKTYRVYFESKNAHYVIDLTDYNKNDAMLKADECWTSCHLFNHDYSSMKNVRVKCIPNNEMYFCNFTRVDTLKLKIWESKGWKYLENERRVLCAEYEDF